MVVFLAVAGCALNYEVTDQTQADAAAPTLQVDERLSLEAPLDGEIQGELIVQNIGSSGLSVTDVWLSGSGSFSVLEWPASLAPEEEGVITLGFAPINLTAEGILTLSTNDPDRPEVDIVLTGTGLAPVLSIPEQVEFDGVLVGCTDTELLTLHNTGDADLHISSIQSASVGITVEAELPITLSPDASTDVTLSFTPDEDRSYTSTIAIESNSLGGKITTTAHGEGALGALVEERFRQGGGERDAVDLMFTVDQSCSMFTEHEILSREATAMFEALQDTEVDYRVMVVTDDGCHSGTIIDPETNNAESIFVNALNGDKTTYSEAGLTQARNALESTGSGDCNAGFLREGVTPSLIHISDEAEQSPEGWDTVLSDILEIEPRTVISAIAGDYPSGCPSASAGAGYYEATQTTGGLFLSICESDWADHIDNLVTVSTSLKGEITDTFPLAEEPVLETLSVAIDGVVAESGWSYDAALNAIVFASAPEPDAVIEVGFRQVCQP